LRYANFSQAGAVTLGIALYELLTGHRPYRLRSRVLHEIARIICEEEPTRPSMVVATVGDITTTDAKPVTVTPEQISSVREGDPAKLKRRLSGDLDSALLMALRKEPEHRYSSVDQLSEDLRRHLDSEPLIARKGAFSYRTGRFVRRHVRQFIAVFVIVAVSTCLGLWVSGGWHRNQNVAPRIIDSSAGGQYLINPVLPPDGRHIVYAANKRDPGNLDIYVMDVKGSAPLRLTHDPADDYAPKWSQDGRRVAFIRQTREGARVLAVPSRGGSERELLGLQASDEFAFHSMDWSPDGQSIVLAGTRKHGAPYLVIVSVSDGRWTQLTFPATGVVADVEPAFAPDGRRVVFVRWMSAAVGDLFYVPSTGGDPKRLTFDGRRTRTPVWTSDGKQIVYSSARAGILTLWRVSAEGGTPVRVPSISGAAASPSISHDFRYLAYLENSQRMSIWRADIVDGQAQPGTPLIDSGLEYDSSPQYSPDGTRIVFGSGRSGNDEIWICDADGGNPRQLTSFLGAHSGAPRWSPDGQYIALDSRALGNADIFIVSVQGGTPRQLITHPGADEVPSWSRDGKWIYFHSDRSGRDQVWKMSWQGGPAVQVTMSGGADAFESFDGRSIYYMNRKSQTDDARLWKLDLQTGHEERLEGLPELSSWGHWALTRNGIYYSTFINRNEPPVVRFFDFETRVSTTIMSLKSFPGPHPTLAVSPDGRHMLYTHRPPPQSKLMLLENPRLR
jgi:Tol biopolymer transport system component